MPYTELDFDGLSRVRYTVGSETNSLGRWNVFDSVGFYGSDTGPCIAAPSFTLDSADALPVAGLDTYTLFEPEVPVLPWVNPSIGDIWNSTLLGDVDPPPDYFTVYAAAGISVDIPCPTGDGPDDFVHATATNLDGQTVYENVTDSASQKEVWVLPPGLPTLPTSVPEDPGSEGTHLLWEWADWSPSVTASWDFTFWRIDGATLLVVVTPYWIVDRPDSGFMAVL